MNHNIFPHHYQEFKESFIDDDLIRLNVTSLDGIAAQQKYFESWEGDRLNSGAPAGRLLEKTNHLLEGAWSVDIETAKGLVPHFKPDKPRIIDGKLIKYEQVKGTPNGYLLPKITYRHVKLIADKFKIKKYPKGDLNSYCGQAWDWIAKNKKIPIGIDEGWKKAMALCSVGIPCIGISGVFNFNNCGKDKIPSDVTPKDNNLLDCFRKFKDHTFVVYYDMDEKETTKENVNKAVQQLTKALSFTGISKTVYRCYWSGAKGIDDYLYENNGNTDRLIYEQIIIGQTYKKVKADLTIHERYLTENGKVLPEIKKALDSHKVILLDSPKNSGKTSALSDYTYAFQMEGVKVFIPSHRITLMGELSRRFTVANAETWRTSLDKIFGLAMCIDSMHSNSSVRFTSEMLELFRGCVLVIDEVDQVLDHLSDANTDIKSHRKAVNENLTQLFKIASKVIGSSADVSQEVADFLEVTSRVKPFVIRNTYKVKGGHCKVYKQSQPHKLYDDAEKAIASGERIMFFTTGQKYTSTWSTITLEKHLKDKYPHLKIGRIDAETVADKERTEYKCFDNLNEFIDKEQYDILIVSPVMGTGIDITSKHFDSFWGINWGVIPVNSFAQAMGRIRDNIPRYIWSSNSFLGTKGNGSCFASQLKYSQLNQSATNKLIFQYYDDEFNPYIDDCLLEYWCKRAAIVNTQGKQLQKATIEKFTEDYETIEIDDIDLDKDTKEAIASNIKTTKEENTNTHYQNIIESPLINDCKLDELRKRKEKTASEKCTERANNTIRYISPRDRKVKLTPEILEAEDNGFFPKLELDWLLRQGVETTHKLDKQRVVENEYILDSNRKCKAAKVNYLDRFGIREITDNPGETYHNKHPLIQKAAKRIRSGFNSLKEVKTTVKDFWNTGKIGINSSDWSLVKWALELIGYGMTQTKRTKQGRFYGLTDMCGVDLRRAFMDYWGDEKLDLIEKGDKSSEAQNQEVCEGSNVDEAKSTVPSEGGDKNLYINNMNNITEHLSPPKIAALPETPTLTEGDQIDFSLEGRAYGMADVVEVVGSTVKAVWGWGERRKIIETPISLITKVWRFVGDDLIPVWEAPEPKPI